MKRTEYKIQNQGQILILSLIFLVVVMILSAAMFSQVTRFIQGGSRAVAWEQATVIADAGADYAVFKFNTTQGYSGSPEINLGVGTFRIDIADFGSNKKITSTGCIPSWADCKIKRIVKVEAQSTGGSGTAIDYGQHNDLFCISSSDCKISYYDVTNQQLRVIDCQTSTCDQA